jgi:DHA3 family macrolide efflux protein-like MFS transporter
MVRTSISPCWEVQRPNLAVIWWLTLQTGSPAVLALASIAGILPIAIIGPFAGVWVDRLSRKTYGRRRHFFVAAAGAVLDVYLFTGTPPTWLIYLILFLRSVWFGISTPWHFKLPFRCWFLQAKLTRNRMGDTSSSCPGSIMLGPFLGTFIMTVLSLPLVMLVDIVAGAVNADCNVAAVNIPDPEPATNGTPEYNFRNVGRI